MLNLVECDCTVEKNTNRAKHICDKDRGTVKFAQLPEIWISYFSIKSKFDTVSRTHLLNLVKCDCMVEKNTNRAKHICDNRQRHREVCTIA